MDKKELARSMKALTICFTSFWILFVILLMLETFIPDSQSNALVDIGAVILLIGLIVFSFGFYINLGMLAKNLGKSWITWVGLSFIFKPFGGIISYSLMRTRVRNALALPQDIK